DEQAMRGSIKGNHIIYTTFFWSTDRIETTDEGTKILTTFDGKLRTISESSIRINLKLNDKAGISSLPDAELFENLALMGQYSKRARIAQSSALPTAADEPTSPLGDDSQGKACPLVSGLEAAQDRANIIKTSTLPHDLTPRVTSLATDGGNLEIASLKAKIKLLEDKDAQGDEPSREDATIKGRSLEIGEEAGIEKSTERGSNDTKKLVNVLTSLDAASILTSGVQVVSVPPAAKVGTVSVPTGSGMVPIASLIFTTASVVTPYARRKDGLDRNNEVIARHLHEYEQAAAELSLGEKIELINELVKHQDHHSKILKYQAQQSNPLSKKQQREFYMSVLKSYSGWKTRHFKGMSLEEIREKFILVWKQIEDFVPMDSKEEGERFKKKWPSDKFLLPDYFLAASEERFPLLSERDAFAEEVCTADEVKHDLSSSIHPHVTTKTIPTVIPTDIPTLRQYSRRARIAQSSALPTTVDEPASPLGMTVKAKIKLLEDKDAQSDEPSREDATIKGRSLEIGEEAGIEKSTKRGSNDTKKLVNVLTSLDAASILTSRVQVVSVPPAAKLGTVSVPTDSVDTPKKKKPQEQIDVHVAREMEEQMTREDQRRSEQIARDAEIARIHAEEELQMLIDGLDRNNEVIARHLHEYKQAVAELSIGEKIELINELVKHQDHHSKILKYQAQQSNPFSKKQQREFYMSVLKSYSGWKTKHFKGMSLEEIREKFILVWKQIEDFVPMASKEEGERFKRKWPRLEQSSAKKMKIAEDVFEEDLKQMMQLHFEREDLTQLWTLVKENLSIRQATSDKEKGLWVELKRLYEPDVKDQLWTHTQALMHDPVE
nr:hypothetical protein [Tanacetum cinerariifolium]